VIETLSWATLEPYLHEGAPWILAMGGTRQARLGYEPLGTRLYVRLPTTPDTILPISRLAEIQIQLQQESGGTVLEVSTASPHFFREFHRFAGLLAEVFESPNSLAIEAFETALARWQEFTATRPALTPEQQIGLLGELVMLEAVLRRHGPASITTWTGREITVAGRHDFRLRSADFEIKSTRAASRTHIIHGLQQLTPAKGRPLYVLSLRFESAGLAPGRSLSSQVMTVRALLSSDANASQEFAGRLSAAAFFDRDRDLYDANLQLSDAPLLIAVDNACPRLTGATLKEVLNADAAARISEVNYRVNFEGLGFPEGSKAFEEVVDGLRFL